MAWAVGSGDRKVSNHSPCQRDVMAGDRAVSEPSPGELQQVWVSHIFPKGHPSLPMLHAPFVSHILQLYSLPLSLYPFSSSLSCSLFIPVLSPFHR